MEPKRIVIVNDGTFKTAEDLDHYAAYVESIKEQMLRANLPKSRSSDPDEPAAIVQVVNTAKEAEKLAAKNEADIVIFVSVSMYSGTT